MNKILENYLDKVNKNQVILSLSSSTKSQYDLNNIKTVDVPLNNTSLIKTVFSKNIGAIVIEPTQITDDIINIDDDYLSEIRQLCDKNNALLIIDITSMPFYRNGKGLLNINNSIKPDVILAYNGIANGMPLGFIAYSEKIHMNISEEVDGVLSSAYDIAMQTIEKMQDEEFLAEISERHKYFTDKINELSEKRISLGELDSIGFIHLLQVDISANKLAKECFNQGLIVKTIGFNKLIFSPSFYITKEEADFTVEKLEKALDSLNLFDKLN